jgi:hypothetical protein
LLLSKAATAKTVKLSLWKARSVWDLRPTQILTTSTAIVQPQQKGYVSFPLNFQTDPGSLYFIQIDADPEIAWALHTDIAGTPTLVPVGTTPADNPGGSMWRSLTKGRSFAMRIAPEQRPYTARNLVTGTNRPDLWTNIFKSDPKQELPAWIELNWEKPVHLNQIQITFDTGLNQRTTLPTFRNPDCVKSYSIAVLQSRAWKTVVEEKNNYARRRVHRIEPATSNKVRITVHETNGAVQARIYEVRIYNEERV